MSEVEAGMELEMFPDGMIWYRDRRTGEMKGEFSDGKAKEDEQQEVPEKLSARCESTPQE